MFFYVNLQVLSNYKASEENVWALQCLLGVGVDGNACLPYNIASICMTEEKRDEQKEKSPPKAEKEPSVEEKLSACETQRDEYLAGWQRAKADFINYKKEELLRLQEIARYGSEDLLCEFIGVLDSFELGLASLEKQGPVEKGIYMIKSQIEDILKKRGLERIQIKIGDAFNPSIAEAIKEVEADKPAGTIIEEVEAGYKLHDKILRPARVKISKGKSTNN